MQTRHIVIEGSIQGVGFRPFVYNLAKKLGIKGKVWNSHKGVEILLQANEKTIRQFLEELSSHPPSLSKIHRINSKTVSAKEQFSDFSIKHSSSSKALHPVIIPTDAAICPKCIEELQDPNNKRYRYPFISCVECGPRYTILKGLPYDRANSAMGAFTPCKECQKEYDDPNNRRFHAQNISCPKCGPDITLYDKEGMLAKGEKALELLAESLKTGRIAALKGIGGYHLVCDASNSEALRRLRSLKRRPHKPFAVMVSKLEDARAYIEPDAYSESLLSSKERPIVIGKKVKQEKLSKLVAPYIDKLGVMLAYTPLHLMLLDFFGKPIVATSANVSGAPICAAFEEIQAHQQLWDICLDHDLDILNQCDDSVVMGVENRTIMLRSARGYAPACFRLPSEMKQNTLLLGANQKNTIGFSFKDHLILSPYLGDLGTVESWEHFERSMSFFKELYHFTPDRYVCDKHPGYETNKWARRQTTGNVTEVQHHAAHIASVMFEHNLNEEVLGVAFDGTGYGDDGTLWGSEFLRCTPQSYRRIAHLKQFKLLGGEAAIKEPRRVALSLLFSLYGKRAFTLQNPATKSFEKNELENLYLLYEKGINAPLSSSVGRLFDAVASLTGICHKITYEGESGLRMEACYDESITQCYPFEIVDGVIDWSMMVESILRENDPARSVSKFFNTLVEIIYTVYCSEGLKLVLSGGVFQNATLLGLVIRKIPDVTVGGEIPVNDGGIAVGQAAYAMQDHL